jgi:hypothetical protein
MSTIQWLTDGAKHVYEQCCCDAAWTKAIKTKAVDHHDSLALSTTLTCFNCGKSHQLDDCPTAPDEARISRNIAAFRTKRREGKKSEQNQRKATSSNNSSSSVPKTTSASSKKKPSLGNRPNNFRPPDSDAETKRVIRLKAHGETVHNWKPATKRWDQVFHSALTTVGTTASNPNTTIPTDEATVLRAQIAELQRQMVNVKSKL